MASSASIPVAAAHPPSEAVHAILSIRPDEVVGLDPCGPTPAVEVLHGTVWVTQEGDWHDHILQAGSRMTLLREGRIVIQGMSVGGARCRIEQVRALR